MASAARVEDFRGPALRLLDDEETTIPGVGDAHIVTRILLIDEDALTARRVRASLALFANQFDVTHVQTVEEALSTLGESVFDVILLDLSMPDTAGMEGFMRMHAVAREVPVVVLTGLEDRFIGARAMMAGASAHLTKGTVDPHELVRSIRIATVGSGMSMPPQRMSRAHLRVAANDSVEVLDDIPRPDPTKVHTLRLV